MNAAIPLSVLIEALECLNFVKQDPDSGLLMPVAQWVRLAQVSGQLDFYVKTALQGVEVGVTA